VDVGDADVTSSVGPSADPLRAQYVGLQAAGATQFTVCRDVAGEVSSLSAGAMSAGSVVEAGSVTKVLTGLLLAVLVNAGEVALSDPVGLFLPKVGTPAGAVTLESLATHTSGLPRLSFGLLARVMLHPVNPYAGVTTNDLVRYTRRARLRPDGEPHYSNLGVALLGQAIAAAAGSDYWTLARTLVLEPLGLTSSGDLPDAETWTAGRLWDTAALGPAGGLRGPVTDLLRLAVCARDPESTPLADAIELATLPRARMGTNWVGLCWISRETPSGRIIWHNGGTGSAWAYIAAGPHIAVAASAASKPTMHLDAAMRGATFAPA
jgi:D-alanyl-D-alanine-carboxypeptidase/D-alanyl-D-alanine-endopeptidase